MITRSLHRLYIKNCRLINCQLHVDAKRGDFANLSNKDLKHFEGIVGKTNVLVEELDPYNIDFMKWYKGKKTSNCLMFLTNF